MDGAPLQESDIAIRLHTGHADLLEQGVRAAFPGIELARGPLETSRRERMLVTFIPPRDEDLSKYDWVHCVGAGVDAICKTFEAIDPKPLVTRTVGRMGDQIGEYCVAYALAHLQKMALRRALQAEARWARGMCAPTYLFETSVAVLGTGAIGQGVARAFSALGATVTGISRSGTPVDAFDRVIRLDNVASHPGADILVAALPLTPQTDELVGAQVFSTLKSALFINVGRGATLDEGALRGALDAGQVSHAVLDVFRDEPLDPSSWLWRHEAITVTPHVSGLTRPEDSVERLLQLLKTRLSGEAIHSDVDISRGY